MSKDKLKMQDSKVNAPIIFLNTECDYGAGLRKWEKIEKKIQTCIGEFKCVQVQSPDEIDAQLSEAVNNGYTKLIAAGGDGTVNFLLNAIMKLNDYSELTVGAIGLGSSNDFHKPFRKDAFIAHVPVRIDFENAVLFDVIKIEYQNQHGQWNTRFCLLNASIGLTAEANAFFNLRHIFVKMLQRISVDLAIFFTALRTIVIYHNKRIQINFDNHKSQKFNVTNLSVLKNPHFSGSLCYDTPTLPNDGQIAVNLCMDLSLLERIRTLVSLAHHRFQRLPKTKSRFATRLAVQSEQVFAIEMDGEIVYAQNVKFSVLQQRVRICK